MLHPEWTGVPAFVTDVRDPLHPYTYAKPVDTKRNNNTTAYTHSVDVDQNGLAWTSGFGGVRGYYTNGMHTDPTTGQTRMATATDPVPYAGGSASRRWRRPGAVRAGQPRAQLVPPHAGGVGHVARRRSPRPPGRTLNKTDLQYVTQENVASCTSTSGGGSGRFVIANLAGCYTGKAWDPERSVAERPDASATSSRSSTTTRRRTCPGSNNGAGCSAHWFTVLGDMVAIAFYGQGTRILDVSDPTDIKQAGYFRVPAARHRAQPGRSQQRVGGLLAQRLHLRRRLHPRHRRPALHGPDQGRRAAEGLLELLR